MDFTLDQLRALDAIERTGSFAGAAAELHRVPSAVSYLIKELEKTLGVDAFDRSGRKAILTPSGRKILAASRDVLAQARALERAVAELKDGWEPELHVVADGALPITGITRCIRRFADPDVPTLLRVDVEYQEGVIDRFKTAEADLALCLGFDGDGDEKGFDCIPLPDLDLVLVTARTHPLADGPLTDARRAQHAEIVVRDSSFRFRKQTKPSFMGSRNAVFLSDFHAKRVALLEGAGYGWIPAHLVDADLEWERLVLLDVEPNRWTYHPQAITLEGRTLGRAGRLFLETLREG
jgi:DNA-binding transcriptional LysR family regulator